MKTIVISNQDYRELVESRDWCRRRGFDGLRQWYDEKLAHLAYRRALPEGAIEYREESDAPPGRGN